MERRLFVGRFDGRADPSVGEHSAAANRPRTQARQTAPNGQSERSARDWAQCGGDGGDGRGGAVLGLLIVGVLAWLLWSGGRRKPATVAASGAAPRVQAPPGPPPPGQQSQPPISGPQSPQPADLPTQQGETSQTQQNGAPEATTVTGSESPAVTSEPTAPAREPEPFELVRFKLDQRLDGFKLPGPVWASAYDEISGRLAITNDEKGVLIYDIDDLLSGDAVPLTAVPTDGLPTAVCVKPLQDRRAFVIAGQGNASLLLVDVESLQEIGRVPLKDLAYVDFLTGSANPDDPCVYYSTHRSDWIDPSISKEDIQQAGDRLGRVNLVTGEQEGHTKDRFSGVPFRRTAVDCMRALLVRIRA